MLWTDRWLDNEALIESTNEALNEDDLRLTAGELWREGRGWMLEKILPYVPESKRLDLAAVVLDNITGAKDRISWGENANGEFTVKSAHVMLTRGSQPKPDMSSLFNLVWKVVTPERVKVFMWLATNQVIMTNTERYRRHMTDSSICQVCKSGEETILHVLRDCQAMSGIWTRLLPARRQREFFTKPLLGWIYENLKNEERTESGSWSTLFSVVIWWGWKWRCDNVFVGNGKCRDRVQFIKNWAREVTTSHELVSGKRIATATVERQIAWSLPKRGWFKLNTDGASRGNPGLATAGGVLRDDGGNWSGGFALNIGRCSAPLAELWGVYYGLYIAWEKRVTRLELEIDSMMVVGFLKTGIGDSHPLFFLVRLCQGFLYKDWIVRISHVFRETNYLADGLAEHAFSLPLGFHAFDVIPDFALTLLTEDNRGSTRSRYVRP